jgi:hypothetical protein
MTRYLRPHYLFVFGGALIGLAIGIFVVDAEPAILGWIIGAGLGLSGGAYIAAITSGEPLVGGGSRSRNSNWSLEDLYGEEQQQPAASGSRERTTNGNGH